MKLTKAELMAAHERQDWQTLWAAAIPLAKLALRRELLKGKLLFIGDDLAQEAMLAVGEAVRLWNPCKGAFSTWVVASAQRRVQNSMQAAVTGMIGGRKNGYPVESMHTEQGHEDVFMDDEMLDRGIEATLAYEQPPAGFRDPLEEVSTLQSIAWADSFLGTVSPATKELLRALFGIGQVKETQVQYAKRARLPLRTVKRHLARVLREREGA